jgi:ABC-type nitrate/sulfonate/bicarbonate transport system substrate-binding protein
VSNRACFVNCGISRRGVLARGATALLASLPPFEGLRRASAAPPLPVAIANAAGNLLLIMQELMRQQGYLEEMGLTPSITNVADGAKITAALIGGDVDLTTMAGFGQIFPAIERGAKLKILAGACMLPTLALYSSKPAVRTLKDLEGRTVGAGALGALLHQLEVALLRKNGIDLAKVTFVNVGSSGDAFRAASVGTVDAGLGETAIADTASRYNVHMLAMGDLTTGLPEYTYQGAYTTDRAIAAKRDVIVRTLAAYAKLYRFIARAEARDAFLKAGATVVKSWTPEEAQSQWNYLQLHKPFAADLVLSEERLAYMQRLNVELGVQRSVLPYAQVCDPSLAKDAIALIS